MSHTLIESFVAHGCRIEIHTDQFAENPRTDWEPLGTFWAWDRRGSTGDANPEISPQDFNGWEEFDAALKARPGIRVALPVYRYSHGGSTYSTSPFSCPWDSGRVGVIFYEKGGEVDDWTDEQITEALKCEIATFSAWANGDFCEYRVIGDDSTEGFGFVSTCCGFASIADAKAEATQEAAAYRKGVEGAERLEASAFAL